MNVVSLILFECHEKFVLSLLERRDKAPKHTWKPGKKNYEPLEKGTSNQCDDLFLEYSVFWAVWGKYQRCELVPKEKVFCGKGMCRPEQGELRKFMRGG